MTRDELLTAYASGTRDFFYAKLSGANLSGANLSGANLSDANLSDAKLSYADLSRANLFGADLSRANLFGANLSDANLSDAKLSYADLSRANLSGAKLSYANLSGAKLSYANLSDAKLSDAKLSGANLSGANLSGAKLSRAKLSRAKLDAVAAARLNICAEGDIIGYKKLSDNVIAQLWIPADAKRSNATGRKCRAEYAIVLAWDAATDVDAVASQHDCTFYYHVGDVVRPRQPFDDDRWVECTSGIHFFLTLKEAEAYV